MSTPTSSSHTRVATAVRHKSSKHNLYECSINAKEDCFWLPVSVASIDPHGRYAYRAHKRLESLWVFDLHSGVARMFAPNHSDLFTSIGYSTKHFVTTYIHVDANATMYALLAGYEDEYHCTFHLDYDACTFTRLTGPIINDEDYDYTRWSFSGNSLIVTNERGWFDFHPIDQPIDYEKVGIYFPIPDEDLFAQLGEMPCFYDDKLWLISVSNDTRLRHAQTDSIQNIRYMLSDNPHKHTICLTLPPSLAAFKGLADEYREGNIQINWNRCGDGFLLMRACREAIAHESPSPQVTAVLDLRAQRWIEMTSDLPIGGHVRSITQFMTCEGHLVQFGDLSYSSSSSSSIGQHSDTDQDSSMAPTTPTFCSMTIPLLSPLSLRQMALFAARRHDLVKPVFNSKHISKYFK